MSTDDKRVRDYQEQIRVRVDNWAQGKGYGPDGWAQDAAEHDVVFLLNHIADLKEAAVPHTVEGGGSDLPAGTVVIDKNGDAWQRYEISGWEVIGGCCCMHHTLPDDGVPYTIVHTPKEEP